MGCSITSYVVANVYNFFEDCSIKGRAEWIGTVYVKPRAKRYGLSI